MKRLGKTSGVKREYDWEEVLLSPKKINSDTDGHAIMVSVGETEEEYAENLPDLAFKHDV